MTVGRPWAGAPADPSAGVTLWPGRVFCPRCGLEKPGGKAQAKPGICRDCSSVMTREERAEWGQPRKGDCRGVREREAA